MQNTEQLETPEEYTKFIAELAEKGLEYRVLDSEKGNTLTVLYMKPSEVIKDAEGEPALYEKCRQFHRPMFAETIRSRLETAGFPLVHIDGVLRDAGVSRTEVIEFCEQMIAAFPTSAVLAGDTNLGKTFGTAWMAMMLFKQRKIVNAEYVRATEVAKERRNGPEGSRWDFKFNRDTDFLVLDDLGTESMVLSIYSDNQDKQGLIQELVDYRLSNKLPTVVTTNLDRDDIMSRYGPRLMNRVERWGNFKGFGGDDY